MPESDAGKDFKFYCSAAKDKCLPLKDAERGWSTLSKSKGRAQAADDAHMNDNVRMVVIGGSIVQQDPALFKRANEGLQVPFSFDFETALEPQNTPEIRPILEIAF